jgi:hypothetical protein
MVGNVGHVIQHQIMETDELPVLGGRDVRLDEVSPFRNSSLFDISRPLTYLRIVQYLQTLISKEERPSNIVTAISN